MQEHISGQVPHPMVQKNCSTSRMPTCSLWLLFRVCILSTSALWGITIKIGQLFWCRPSSLHHSTPRCHARLTSRAIMVLMVITVRCAYWLLEQPGSSQLIHHPELKFFLAQLDKFFGHEITRLSWPKLTTCTTQITHCAAKLDQKYTPWPRYTHVTSALPGSAGWLHGEQLPRSQVWPLEIGKGLSLNSGDKLVYGKL